ncbi:MAG: metal-dependent hydrolase [Rhodocyclaceae bacterium]|nr:metal-dependent hydrolase [Rhodocyclaceae bacterium]
MDSLTQIALGAAVGGAVAGRQFGRKAFAWGALLGTLPDLDVFYSLGDPVSDFTYHRSATHSLLVHALAALPIAWLLMRLHADSRGQLARWTALVFLVLATHALLDAFTVYGTQLLWPLDPTPVGWSTIFIIDPLYTLPLLAGVGLAVRRPPGLRANAIGLALSSLYLLGTVGAKAVIDARAREALAGQGLGSARVLSTPAPFNALLWRIVAVEPATYHEGYLSLLDPPGALRFTSYPRHPELLAPIADSAPVSRLDWFTRGFNAAALVTGDIVVTDLRMGLEPDYIFRFKVGRMSNPHAYPVPPERLPAQRPMARVAWVWQRIFDPAAPPQPALQRPSQAPGGSASGR